MLYLLDNREHTNRNDYDPLSLTISKHSSREKMVLVAYGASGVAGLMYEVVWTRALSLVFGGSTYALSTILAAFLAGLALGSYFAARFADRTSDPAGVLGRLELAIGILGPATLVLMRYLSPVYASLFYKLNSSLEAFFMAQFVVAFLITLPAATLMGATFPLALKIMANRGKVGSVGGTVYAANTIGAIAGSALAGFVLLNLVGSGGTAAIAAALNLAIAAVFLSLSSRKLRGPAALSVGLAAASITAAVYLTGPVMLFNYNMADRYASYTEYQSLNARVERFFDKENAQGRVQVLRADGNVFLVNGGKIEGSSGDQTNQLLLAYLPIASHDNPKSFLNIGLGTGMTVDTAARDPRLDKVYSVEINPAVIEAVENYFYPALFQNDRVVSVVADARNFLVLTQGRYDVISSEPSYPTDSGTAHLFTEDFFKLARSRLKQNGVFAQWVPYYLFSDDELASLVKTFGRVFPESFVWNVDDADMIIIGVNGRAPQVSTVRERVDELLGEAHLAQQYRLIAGPRLVAAFAADERFTINTDDNSLIEFAAARNRLSTTIRGDENYLLRRGQPVGQTNEK